jgi:hypothetical protein
MEGLKNQSPLEKNPEFNFKKQDLESYIKDNYRSLQLESLDWDWEYPDIDGKSPLQDRIIKATFRSEMYPEITANSSAKNSDLLTIQAETKSPEDFYKRIYDWLASSGHSNLKKKELAYMGAIKKQEIIENNAEWLEKEQVTIEEVKIDRPYGTNYTYTVTLRSTQDKMPGVAWGNTIDEALQKSLKEVRGKEEWNKNYQERLWKEHPEFMYVKGGYDKELKELKTIVASWDNDDGNYSVDLSSSENIRPLAHGEGPSWEKALDSAIQKVELIRKEEKEMKKGMLNVTGFSTKQILDLMEGKDVDMHNHYLTIMQNNLEKALKNNEKIGVGKEDLLIIRKKSLDEERYELVAMIDTYLRKAI